MTLFGPNFLSVSDAPPWHLLTGSIQRRPEDSQQFPILSHLPEVGAQLVIPNIGFLAYKMRGWVCPHRLCTPCRQNFEMALFSFLWTLFLFGSVVAAPLSDNLEVRGGYKFPKQVIIDTDFLSCKSLFCFNKLCIQR